MQETQDDDPEVRTEVKVHVTALHEGIKEKLESLISDWTRMNKVVAWTQCTRKSHLKDNAPSIRLYN